MNTFENIEINSKPITYIKSESVTPIAVMIIPNITISIQYEMPCFSSLRHVVKNNINNAKAKIANISTIQHFS